MWNFIFDKIKEFQFNLIYMAVGCSMKDYNIITLKNNQQYPSFLNKYKKKVIILIDPLLEYPLKLKTFFRNNNNYLVQINTQFKDLRYYENSDNLIFALNNSFDYKDDKYINILHGLIEIILYKAIKFILQDYTGKDLTSIYLNICESYSYNLLLSNVIFDITQDIGGCYVDLEITYPKIDEYKNFYQSKYKSLCDIKLHNKEMFLQILQNRINILINPISLKYIHLIKTNYNNFNEYDTTKLLSIIYNIHYDILNNELDYIKNILYLIINALITDIVNALNLDNNIIEYILNNLEDRSTLINILSILKTLPID